MKAFFAVCLVAAVSADPQLLLQQPLVGSSIYSSPIISSALPVTSYIAGQPIVKLAEEKKPVEEMKPLEVETYSAEKKVEIPTVYTTAGVAGLSLATPYTYTAPVVQNLKIVPRYHAKSGPVEHKVLKREAEPQVLLNNWAAQPVMYSNIAAASPVLYNNWAVPAVPATGVSVADDRFKGNFAGKGLIRASAGAVHITKRDAEPQVLLNNWAAPIAPITYNAWAHPAVAPVAYNAFDGVNVAGQTVQNDLVKPQAYAGKGLIRVAPGGKSVHITKRDAEADPAVIYSGLYNYAPSVVRPAVYSSSLYRPAVYSSSLYRPYSAYSNLWY